MITEGAIYNPYFVYGILENEYRMLLDSDWLFSYDPMINVFAESVNSDRVGYAIYGHELYLLPCGNFETLTQNQKDSVDRLYNILCEHYEITGGRKPRLGYFLAINGNYEFPHQKYTP